MKGFKRNSRKIQTFKRLLIMLLQIYNISYGIAYISIQYILLIYITFNSVGR